MKSCEICDEFYDFLNGGNAQNLCPECVEKWTECRNCESYFYSDPTEPVEYCAECRWPRADPEALAAFDPSTKTCVMNCGPHVDDPRSAVERFFLCDECEVDK